MNSIKAVAKNLSIKHNVSLRVIDQISGKVVSSHEGHNAATNSLVTGIGHYLMGEGVLRQGQSMLSTYLPMYMSVGTMGLINQEEDENGLPAGIGVVEGDEEKRFSDYIMQNPGFGADGYDVNVNNNRKYMGLGPTFDNRPDKNLTINCELISTSFPRAAISYRELVPEIEAELPQTIDVIYSGMISTGALAQFREIIGYDDAGNPIRRPYVFITEAGLWSRPDWVDGGENGLLAGYRIVPPNQENWDMHIASNRDILKQNILKVGINQVVQVIWKIQIGGMDQLGGITSLYPEYRYDLYWDIWS